MNACSKLNVLKLQYFLRHSHFEIIVDLEEVGKMVTEAPSSSFQWQHLKRL